MKNNSFERQYQERGLASQRQYPNENLIGFIAGNFYKAPSKKDVKILEVGCGSGANLWYIGHEGFSAYGTDHSETGISLCKETLAKWQTTAELAVCDMTEIPFDERFDAIVDVVSMQHLDIPDHKKTYAKIFEKLKGGGKFFSYHLGMGSIIATAQTIEDAIDDTKPLAHNGLMTFLSPNDAEEMLKEIGFSSITVETLTRTYENRKHAIEYLIINATKQ